jgi:hypothetical protein
VSSGRTRDQPILYQAGRFGHHFILHRSPNVFDFGQRWPSPLMNLSPLHLCLVQNEVAAAPLRIGGLQIDAFTDQDSSVYIHPCFGLDLFSSFVQIILLRSNLESSS